MGGVQAAGGAVRGAAWATLAAAFVLVGAVMVGPVAPAAAQGSTNGAWTITPTPSLPGATNGLYGVSCAGPEFCVAVGATSTGMPSPVIEEWNGSAWSSMAVPSSSTIGALGGVSCLSASFCMAVGRGTYPAPQTDVWNGVDWTNVPAPSVGGTATGLLSVSCVTPTFCAAVGAWGSGYSSVMETWNGSSWTLASPTQGNINNLTSQLNAVSCPTSDFCMAVGDNGTTTWNGSSWAPGPPLSGISDGLDCSSSTSCTAVGNLYGQTHAVATFNGTGWTGGNLPSDGGTPYGLSSVSCQGSTCYAVGASFNGSASADEQPVVLTGSNGSWTFQQSPMLPAQPGGSPEAISCGPGVCVSVGQVYDSSGNYQPLAMVSGYPTGYWLVASDGGIFTYGNANFYGSSGAIHLNEPIVGMAATPNGKGYWLVASDGGIFTYGNAGFYGSTGSIHLNKPIVGMAATADGGGYWLVASDGGIFTYGDANFWGSAGALHLNRPIVGMAATTNGGGYWLAASDGGIFTYGNANFAGSAGALHLNQPIVDVAATPDGGGYWLGASDGGIFTYGDANFWGSAGAVHLNRPIVGTAATWDGGGYWLVASDGGIFNYGDAGFYGSAGSIQLNRPIVGMAAF